jgi:hypothetical protein
MYRIVAFILLGLGVSATTAEAAHIRGHYGGVPAVQPAPLPWHPQPAPGYRDYAPPQRQPSYAPPQRPVYVAPPPLGPNHPPRRGPNVCEAINCD